MSELKFQSRSGMFGLCTGVLDQKSGKFHKATEDETMACCLTSCRPEIRQCLDTCMDMYGPQGQTPDSELYIYCRNNCARILLACKNSCGLIDPKWGNESPVVQCIEDKGCGEFPIFDRKCIENNGDYIKSCCESRCVPSSTMNCKTHCDLKYLDFIGKSEEPLVHMYDNDPRFTSQPVQTTKKSVYTSMVLILIALIFSIVFGIMLLKSRM